MFARNDALCSSAGYYLFGLLRFDR